MFWYNQFGFPNICAQRIRKVAVMRFPFRWRASQGQKIHPWVMSRVTFKSYTLLALRSCIWNLSSSFMQVIVTLTVNGHPCFHFKILKPTVFGRPISVCNWLLLPCRDGPSEDRKNIKDCINLFLEKIYSRALQQMYNFLTSNLYICCPMIG